MAKTAAAETAPAEEVNPRDLIPALKLKWIQDRIVVTKNRGKGHDEHAGVTYEFRNAEDILERAKPLCAAVDAMITVDVVPAMIGESVPVQVVEVRPATIDPKDRTKMLKAPTFAKISGPRFCAVATAIFTDCATGTEIKRSSFAEIDFWRAGQTEPEKLCGSSDSYASKYALQHLLALDNNRDADMEANERVNPKAAAAAIEEPSF